MKTRIEKALAAWIDARETEQIEKDGMAFKPADFNNARGQIRAILDSSNFNRYFNEYHIPMVNITKLHFVNKKAYMRLLGILRFLVDGTVPVATARTLLLMLAGIALSGGNTAIQWDSGFFSNLLVNDTRLTAFCDLLELKQVTSGSVSTQLALAKAIAVGIGIVSMDKYKRFSLNPSAFWTKKLLEKIGLI